MSKTLYAIDVFNLMFQVFHAIPAMTGPSGQPTNAVFGMTRDILNLLKTKQPDYLVCAIDMPGAGVREDIYPEYKANRTEMPEELPPQIPVIIEMLQAFGIPVIGCEGWEADDVLATLARRAEAADIDTFIVTGDKDARQLLTSRVRLYNVRKDTVIDEAVLLDDWGIRPDQVVDFQSLVGDKVDNVPGVPLVGPKKAAALLNEFGSLEEVLANAHQAPGRKLQENLTIYADQARISRQLVELNGDLDFHLDWESARAGRMDLPRLTECFRECGFRRFIDEARQLMPADSLVQPRTLFGDGRPSVELVTSRAALDDVVSRLRTRNATTEGDAITLRLETSGLDPMTSSIVAVTIALDDDSAAFIPVSRLVSDDVVSIADIGRALTDLAGQHLAVDSRPSAVAVTLDGHDLKQTIVALRQAGIPAPASGLDSMVACYLLEAGSRSHGLAGLVDAYLGAPLHPLSTSSADASDADGDDAAAVTARGSKSGPAKSVSPRHIPLLELAKHSAEEACAMRRVGRRIRTELEDQHLYELYDRLERPLISVLADMEHTGVRVDPEELERQNQAVSQRIDELIGRIHIEADEEFNIDSPKQLATVLFDKLQLPVIKKTKTGASTDQAVLETLAAIHPLPKMIIEHRHLVKLKGTYLDALPRMIHPVTGRIHASFHQVVAATGRLSSSHPNLQNIPIRTEEGSRIRRAFVPGEPGWKLICADYSQIELRILAHFSQDAAMLKAFADGIDIHRAVAADVFNVAPEDVDAGMRRIAKAVNFGVIYGQTPWGLSAALGITKEEAAAFIENYFATFSGVATFMEAALEACRESGFSRTILGRRRAISGIRSSAKRGSSSLTMPERTAVNTVIQGSAADLIKQAMVNIHQRLIKEQSPARMLLQIHDELMFETPAERAEEVAALVRHEMETAFQLDVPLTVDLAIGDNWLDAKG